MQKIALPIDDTLIAEHFGHSSTYVIATLLAGQPREMEVAHVPSGCACSSDLLERLQSHGVTHIFAGTMGKGAHAKSKRMGFEVVRGCSGPYLDVLRSWIDGKLQDLETSCDHSHGTCGSH